MNFEWAFKEIAKVDKTLSTYLWYLLDHYLLSMSSIIIERDNFKNFGSKFSDDNLTKLFLNYKNSFQNITGYNTAMRALYISISSWK